MKRLREIIRSLFILSRQPSGTISAAWAAVRASALPHPDSGTLPVDSAFMQSVVLLDNIVGAVVEVARGEEIAAAKSAATTEVKP